MRCTIQLGEHSTRLRLVEWNISSFTSWKYLYHSTHLGVHEWDWVHERLFMPEGIKNVHALNPIHEPRSYISLWWTILHTPLFCRFIPLIFQKYTKNHHLYCHFPHLKVPVKSATCLECTIQNRGVRCACTYVWAHNNKYLWRTSNFFSITFSEILSYFSNRINRLKIIYFKKVGLTFIENNHSYFWKWYQISTNIDYWQGHERYSCMVTCGLLTNHRHGNHILMYE